MNYSGLLYRFFKVPQEVIYLLKAIFESYEGMCIVSTIDRDNGIIQVTIASDFKAEIDEVIEEFKERFSMHEVYHDIAHSLGKF